MEDFIKIGAIGIIGAILTLSIKKQSPVMAVLISVATGIFIAVSALSWFRDIFAYLNQLSEIANLPSNLYMPLLKITGISIVVKICSEICKDAGEGALSSKVELAGVGASVLIAIPLFSKVLNLISSMV